MTYSGDEICHWSFFLSFCLFSYNGVCYDGLKLSVSDVIVGQKGSNGDRKLQFFGWDNKWCKGNTLHCTKRIQNKTKIVQWRLLNPWRFLQEVHWLLLHFLLPPKSWNEEKNSCNKSGIKNSCNKSGIKNCCVEQALMDVTTLQQTNLKNKFTFYFIKTHKTG